MKANVQHGPSPKWRVFLAAMMGLVVVTSSDTARGTQVNISQEIADLQAQTVKLSKEIEMLKGETATVEQKWEKIASVKPPSFHTAARAIQISSMTAAWTDRPSTSGSGNNGVAPILAFDLKNVGTAPITEVDLVVSFYKPDKEVIGGATIGLFDASDAPLRTGMWKKVTVDYHLIQFPDTRSVIALNADLYLQTDPGSYVLIDTYKISPRLEP